MFDRNMMRFVLSYAVDHQFQIPFWRLKTGWNTLISTLICMLTMMSLEAKIILQWRETSR